MNSNFQPCATIGRATQEVSGEFKTGGQYHFHMENQSCLVRPGENGQYHVKSSTQYMDSVQTTVSSALGIAKNKVDVKTMRLGGAYGAKIFKPRGVAGACAIAAHALGKPVRLILDLETNMRMMGKRSPYLFTYSVGQLPQYGQISTVSLPAYFRQELMRILWRLIILQSTSSVMLASP